MTDYVCQPSYEMRRRLKRSCVGTKLQSTALFKEDEARARINIKRRDVSPLLESCRRLIKVAKNFDVRR